MEKLNEREIARRDELVGKENKTEAEEQELATIQRKEKDQGNQ